MQTQPSSATPAQQQQDLPAEHSSALALAQIQNTVKAMLGMLPAIDQPLMEAGVDSLGAVELQSQLEKALSIELPATVMFDYPSMGAMAGFIAGLLQPEPVGLQ